MSMLTAVSGYKTYVGLFLIGLAGICSAVGQEDVGTPMKTLGESLLAVGAAHKIGKQMSGS